MLLRAFSLLFAGLSLGAGCSTGPKVTLCDFTQTGPEPHLICVDHDNNVFQLTIAEAEERRFIAMPSDDMRTLIEYCGLKSRQKAAVLNRAEEVMALLEAAHGHL